MTLEIVLVLAFCIFIIIYMYVIDPKLNKHTIKNNNEYGSARFATEAEIKNQFDKEDLSNIKKAGFPIWYSKDYKTGWFDNDTPHWCFLGSSGSGKSYTAVIPECTFFANAEKKRSVFVTDPKGEIFGATSQMFKDHGYKIITIDFRNPQKSSHFNILQPVIDEWQKYIDYDKIANEIDSYIKYQEAQNKLVEKINNAENENVSEIDIDDDEDITISPEIEDKYRDYTSEKLQDELLANRNKATSCFAETRRLINSISAMIFKEANDKDPFWNDSASSLLQGIIGLFCEEYKAGKIKKNQITMTSVKKFQNSTMESNNFKKFTEYINKKPYGSMSRDSLTTIISASENTYKSITAVFGAKMTLFDDVNVANVTSSSDFDFDILGKEPTALFVIVPDEDKTYFTLVTIIVGLLYKELVKLANAQPNKKCPVQIDWLLDEFANCPPLNDIEAIVSVARSRGMRFQFFIQSFAQLDNVYGKEVAQIILDNCGLTYLKTNTMDTAKTISERLGKTTIENNSISQTANTGLFMTSQNYNANRSTSLIARDLLTPDEIMQLKYKTIIFCTQGYPIFRSTVGYDRFSCYEKGEIPRTDQLLRDLSDTYFTVENLVPKVVPPRMRQENRVISRAEKDTNQHVVELEDQALQYAVEQLQEILAEKDFTFRKREKGNRSFCEVTLKNMPSAKEKINIDKKLKDNDAFEVTIDSGEGNSTVIRIESKSQFAIEELLKSNKTSQVGDLSKEDFMKRRVNRVNNNSSSNNL